MEIRIGGHYMIHQKIGQGSFGDIWRGKNLNNDEEIAVKLERKDKGHSQLHYEYKV